MHLWKNYLRVIISENQKEPAKIHDLLRLAAEALVDNLQTEIQETLRELNTIYISTRYPDDFEELELEINEDKAKLMLKKTKELFKWLEKKIN